MAAPKAFYWQKLFSLSLWYAMPCYMLFALSDYNNYLYLYKFYISNALFLDASGTLAQGPEDPSHKPSQNNNNQIKNTFILSCL